MWKHYRRGKHIVAPLFLSVSYYLMTEQPELSPLWIVGLTIALVTALAYLIEELIWISQGAGRPCGNCGSLIRMKSFQIRIECPECGEILE